MICEKCNHIYNKDEILTMVSLFKKYDGFFNQLNSHNKSVEQIVYKLLNDLKKEKNLSKMFEINEKALHLTFLCGYRPKIFIGELRKIHLS